jgi:hypothetical protein
MEMMSPPPPLMQLFVMLVMIAMKRLLQLKQAYHGSWCHSIASGHCIAEVGAVALADLT